MTKRVWALVLWIVLSAGWAFAADVDGRWTGSMTTPEGEVPVTFVFKAEGEKLTGAMIGMDGNEIPIADGKIGAMVRGMPSSASFSAAVSAANTRPRLMSPNTNLPRRAGIVPVYANPPLIATPSSWSYIGTGYMNPSLVRPSSTSAGSSNN